MDARADRLPRQPRPPLSRRRLDFTLGGDEASAKLEEVFGKKPKYRRRRPACAEPPRSRKSKRKAGRSIPGATSAWPRRSRERRGFQGTTRNAERGTRNPQRPGARTGTNHRRATWRRFWRRDDASCHTRINLQSSFERRNTVTKAQRISPQIPRGIFGLSPKSCLMVQFMTRKKKITDEGLNDSAAKYFPASTVLVAMYGANVGQLVSTMLKPETVNQAICGLVVDDKKADWRYVFYSLLKNRKRPQIQAQGAAQQNLNQT